MILRGTAKPIFAAAFSLLCAGQIAPAFAQGRAEVEPPPPDPWTIPADAFASRSALSGAQLSPDGSKFAFLYKSEDGLLLSIVDANTKAPITAVNIGSRENFNWFRWAGNNRIMFSMMRRVEGLFSFIRYSRLMAYDMDAEKLRYIGFEEQGLEGDDVLYTDPNGDWILLSVSSRLGRQPEVWRFPLDGSGEDAAVRVQKKGNDVDEWWADDAGVVRFGMGWTRGGATIIHYRSGPEDEFERITKFGKRDDEERDSWDVIGLRQGLDTGYAFVDGDDGKRILRELDYRTGELGPVFFEHSERSLDTILSRPGEGVVGARWTDDEPQTKWFNADLVKYQSMLEQALPGGSINIASLSRDLSRMLVIHSGPADPGAMYIFTPGERRLDLFANLRPKVDFRALSSPKPVQYTARDGTRISAYLTLPKWRPEKTNLPFIIMPHGGPYGVRDAMTYDDWVQLLASRGYAVLQPNYRGSGGYGDAFQELGDGQIGRGMQDDLDDAMDWAVSEGIADPAKTCLIGASYGGYAALWGVIRNPERYRCAVSFAGVTDWEDLLDYDKDFFPRRFYKEYKNRVEGDTKGFDLSQVSPKRRAKEIKRPILLVQGTKDSRVPIKQYRDFVKAAEGVQPALETLEFKGGDHHLSKEENERAFYEAMLAFLAKHNPTGLEVPQPTDAEAEPGVATAEADLSATGG